MSRPKKADLETMLRDARREGWIQAMMESGPRPINQEQAEHFTSYYKARATIVYPD